MTNLITLTIPNDDHIALRAFGKALEEMALAHGAEPRKTVGELSYKLNIDTTEATAALEHLNAATAELMQAAPQMMDTLRFDGEELQGKRKEPEIDTTAQQVESLVERIEENLEIAEQPFQGEVAPTTDSTGTPWDERIHSASKALNSDGTWRLRRKPKDMDEAEWAALVESIKNELMGVDEQDLKEFEESKQAILEPSFTWEQNPININHVSIDSAHEKGDEIREAMDKAERGEANKGVTVISQEGVEVVTEELCIDEGCDHYGTPHICVTPEPSVTPPGDDFHTDAGVVTEQTVAGIPPIPVPPPVVVPPVTEEWTFPKLMTFLTERQGKIDVATVNMLLAQDGIASLPELNAHPDKIGPFVARVKAHLGE